MRYLIAFGLIITTCLSMAQTYSVASYQWEPYIDSNKPDEGISMALVAKIFEAQGHSINIIHAPFARALDDFKKSKVDILPAVWLTEERLKYMAYSETYLSNRLVFVKAKGDPFEYHSFEDLNDKMIGVLREYAYDGKVLDHPHASFPISDSLQANIKKVTTKRIDLTVDDEYTIKATTNASLLDKIEFVNNALDESPLFITCLKTNPQCPEIISTFNKGLSLLKSSGELDTIISNIGK